MAAGVAEFREGGVRGYLHRPERDNGDGLVLTHGAGGNAAMPLLIAVAEAFADAGMTVLRCDLPFRQKRPYGPPAPAGAAADRAGLREAAAAVRAMVRGRVFLGGQSYGGRQASMAAAEDAGLAAALLLLSYPLHPPDKPAQLRAAHFPNLRTPALFVHGARDPFATRDELDAARALIPARTAVVEIAGAGHDLARSRFDARATAVEPLLALL